MAAPRLTFLWPFLFKQSTIQTVARTSRRTLKTSGRKRQEVTTQRYGSANEPPPGIQKRPTEAVGNKSTRSGKNTAKDASDSSSSKVKKEKTAKDEKAQSDVEATANTSTSEKGKSPPGAPAVMSVDIPSQASSPPNSSTKTTNDAASPSQSQHRALLGPDGGPPPTAAPPPPLTGARNPLETVLNMPSNDAFEAAQIPPQAYYHENASTDPAEHRPPHIATPQYVHHFDTYSLVRNLNSSGWTDAQAITVMKAVRLILSDNMDLARDGLVSKSNVENETYLFRAACSELRTEVELRRKAETEKARTERTGLQHEVDILGQRLGMEVSGLKETMKGMTEGRKMEVRDEGRGVDSKIQELNYRITVALNSDSRSDVEGVRWIITKRAITALAICVLMVLTSLKYASGVMQAEEEARKKREKAESEFGHGGGNHNHNGGSHGGSAGSSSGSANNVAASGLYDAGLMPRDGSMGDLVVRTGDNPGYISLG